MNQQLQKLDDPARCGLAGMRPCGQTAHWQMLNSAHGPQVAVCDTCIILMADMNDDNEAFFLPALDEIADRHERRRLFVRTMRKPEMRMLRLALRYLDWDKGIDWQSVQSLYCEYYADDRCWMLTTDKYLVVCLDAQNPNLTYEDFYLIRLHQEGDPACLCEFCETERHAA